MLILTDEEIAEVNAANARRRARACARADLAELATMQEVLIEGETWKVVAVERAIKDGKPGELAAVHLVRGRREGARLASVPNTGVTYSGAAFRALGLTFVDGAWRVAA